MSERTKPFGHNPPRTPREELLSRCQERDCGYESPCWIWLGALDKDGYGRFKLGRVERRAHRAAYHLFVGPVPKGLQVHHRCENPSCINPDHLEPLTCRDNLMVSDITAAARGAAQTHCIHGHEFTPENTYIKPEGTRACRECLRRRKREFRARLKVAA